jgi:hypothetical protein
MRASLWRVSAVVILSLMCLACGGGGGGGGNGPTEPPAPTGKRFVFSVFASPLGSGTLIEASLSLDGREIDRRDWQRTTGSACTILCSLNGDERGLTPGNHTLTYTVVRQVRQTTEYDVNGSGVVTDLATGQQRAIILGSRSARLGAGQSVTYTVFL